MSIKIHPTAVVEKTVTLHRNVTVGAYAVICGDVEVGEDTWIGNHVTIGTPAQFSNRKFELNDDQPAGQVRIGSRVVIREYVTVHQPSVEMTIIEDDAYLMAYAHVSHDTRIRRGAVLSNSVQTGGFSDVGERANIGLGCVLHQFTTIGAFAMVGMGSVVTKDVPPFVKAFGNPMRLSGVNSVGLQRAGIGESVVAEVLQWHEAGCGNLNNPDMARHLKAYEARRAITRRPELSNGVSTFR
jgi:UDP-N-acetylglucosamine acyltransferase